MEVFPSRGLSRTCQWLWWPAVRLSPVLAPWHPYWQPSPTAAYPRSTHGVIIAMEIATALLSPQHTSSAVPPEPECATCWAGGSMGVSHELLTFWQQQGAQGQSLGKGSLPELPCFFPWWGRRMVRCQKFLSHVVCLSYRYAQQLYQDHYHKFHSWKWSLDLLNTVAKLLRFLSKRGLWLQRLCFCGGEGRGRR